MPLNRMGVTVMPPPATSGTSAPQPFFVNPLPSSEQKRRTSLVVLVIMLAFILIGVVAYVALVGSAGKAINEGITGASTEASPSRHAANDKRSRQVSPGKAFTVGKYRTLAGWKVEQDTGLGDGLFSITGKVKNVGDATATAYIHFKFIDKSGEVLGNVQCNSADLKPGQTQVLNCIPDGKYGKYKKITAEASS